MSGKRRGPGTLRPEDRALWSEIGKSVTPLPGRPAAGVEAGALTPAADASMPVAPAAEPAPSIPKTPPPLTMLDRRARQRIARGRVEIDARLDLHGMSLERARARLAHFLATAQTRGAGIVLVITGKGTFGAEGERGALRREVPQWLSLPEFRSLVIGFEEAAPRHGGAGALYVRIRRARS
jgi:DNA-nicking Smr family endonuclease